MTNETRNEAIQQLDAAWNALTDDLSAAVSTAQLIRNKAINALRERENLKDDQIARIKKIEANAAVVERLLKTVKEIHHDY